jgi:beta-lactamase superfamily II metal-dependent hydrolase
MRGEQPVKCEIEFIAVGDASRAGDAIVIRYGEPDDYKLMLVDGGTTEAGQKVVEHLKKHFGADVRLEHIVLTHADSDHASGLREVLKDIPTANLWMFVPWWHAGDALQLFKKKDWTAETLAKAIQKEYDILNEIITLATQKNVGISCPEQGAQIGPFRVLSPRKINYVHLIPQFEKTPDPDQEKLEGLGIWIGKTTGLSRLLEAARAKVEKWTTESWTREKLKDGGITGASNESSVVLYANLDKERILLTGDAGLYALSWAAGHANEQGYPLQNFTFVQVPHHGSRRNVGPSILNSLLGPIQPEGTVKGTAFVSAPKDDERHPRLIVLNAFERRGYPVHGTQGQNKIHYGGFPKRAGYTSSEKMPFSTTVEEYD